MQYDLIYDGEALQRVNKLRPHWKTEDASDFIHEGRFSVENKLTTEEHLKAILRLGLHQVSFTFQIHWMDKDKVDMIKTAIHEWVDECNIIDELC